MAELISYPEIPDNSTYRRRNATIKQSLIVATEDVMPDDMRAAFEAWIAAPPHERPVARNPLTHLQPGAAAWFGQYADYQAQLAWEAWQEATKRFETAVGFRRHGGTCHLHRTAEGLRQELVVDGCSQVCWLDRVILHE